MIRSVPATLALLALCAFGNTGVFAQASLAAPAPEEPPVVGKGPFIVIDQFGYLPAGAKVAVLRSPVHGFDREERYTPGATLQVIATATGKPVFTGTPVAWKQGQVDASSGDRVWTFDFSALDAPGRYEILDVERQVRSTPFEIGENVYRTVLMQAVRSFYYQRAGQAKLAQFAGAGWADGPSHLGPLQDANARRYDAPNDASTERDLRGGWFDAGDYNKYTSWTASYIVEMLQAYLQNKFLWTDDFNIPESGNGLPDLLDEVKWGLDYLVRLQEPNGSALSVVGLSHASPPSAAKGPSLYGPASTSATLAAARAYAFGAKVFGAQDSPAFRTYAAELAQRARRAWVWAAAHPHVIFRNNDAAEGTGGLAAGQQEVDDAGRAELRLGAAVYLFDLTTDPAYRAVVDAGYTSAPMFKSGWLSPFTVSSTGPLLHYASLANATPATASAIRSRYAELWNRDDNGGWGAIRAQRDPYGAYLANYTWGSNAIKSNAGNMFADEARYGLGTHSAEQALDAAAAYLHYLHGVNPLGKVYLSNMGRYGATNSVDRFYHSWFAAGSAQWGSVKASRWGPPPGFLVGGANPSYAWDSRCPGVSTQCGAALPSPPAGQPPQKSYADFNQAWPLNSWEVTENSGGYQVAYIRLLSRFVK
ncbi:MAG: glycoside hydrolase family 9 protein [Paucibacter sp.]|nr:glycoside hydrolase family 9 protein [Roseateles sp.]